MRRKGSRALQHFIAYKRYSPEFTRSLLKWWYSCGVKFTFPLRNHGNPVKFFPVFKSVMVSHPLELELQLLSSMWVLGIEPGSSGRTNCAVITEPFFQPSQPQFELQVLRVKYSSLNALFEWWCSDLGPMSWSFYTAMGSELTDNVRLQSQCCGIRSLAQASLFYSILLCSAVLHAEFRAWCQQGKHQSCHAAAFGCALPRDVSSTTYSQPSPNSYQKFPCWEMLL